ncbi:MAG TPA: nuclease-related domain-containing protein, partial [Acidimicrobiales bacterium]|nr:nuclease-related domain-containing protein [Acidimicrobiales bacterium]
MTPRAVVRPETQSTRAWAEGAAGERLGAVLDGCDGVVSLHDRRIPRSKANIDHLVIGPSGIFVVDAKNYDGLVEKRQAGGWLRPDERLVVAGRDRTKLIEGVVWQINEVRTALGPTAEPIRPILCFVGPNWPRFLRRALVVRGVSVVWAARAAEIVSEPGPIGEERV